MKNTHGNFTKFWRLSIASIALVIASNSVFGQFYLQGGASYWPDLHTPSSILSERWLDENDSTSNHRNSDLWLGTGYSVNEEWSFEVFFSKLPSTEVSSKLNLYSTFGDRLIVPQSISISQKTETTIIGVGAVYDFYIGERLSLIGKAGVAYTTQESEIDVSFPRFRFPTFIYDDDDYYDDWFEDYLDLGDDESMLDMYFAIGVRLPIQETQASVTATYQFVNTPGHSESGLLIGIRWNL